MDWPLYFADSVTLGDPDSSLAICTLWTPRDKAVAQVTDYAIAGQLYSGEGLSYLVRNLLAKPTIRHLLLVGRDMTTSGVALTDWWFSGDGMLHGELSLPAIDLLRRSVRVYDHRGVIRAEDVAACARDILRTTHALPWGAPQVFPYAEPSSPTLPCPEAGYVVRGTTVAVAYARLLWHVMTYGVHAPTQHTSPQRESLAVLTVVTDEPGDTVGASYASWMPFQRASLGETLQDGYTGYLKQLLSPEVDDGVAYTYGSRLRSYHGIDQIAQIADELFQEGSSRRAVACLWDVEKDSKNPSPPCLNLIQARLRQGKVYVTAYFRSHDVYRAWAVNAYGLRAFQGELATALYAGIGDLALFSQSAHVYSHDWQAATEVVACTQKVRDQRHDPFGAFTIGVEQDAIVVRHFHNGAHLQTFRGTARELEETLAPYIGESRHALYVGRELHRAQTLGRAYRQDSDAL